MHIIYVNEKGKQIADVLAKEIREAKLVPFSEISYSLCPDPGGMAETVVFIGAMGICVRSILPLINDKHTDPAVVCIDSCGQYAIPVLSGHVGGANDLARRLARILGAQAIITTQSDNEGKLPLDTIAKQYGWNEETVGYTMNEAIAHYVNNKPIKLIIEHEDEGTKALEANVKCRMQNAEFCIAVTPRLLDKFHLLHSAFSILYYRPLVLHLGIGCAHCCSVGNIPEQIIANVREAGYSELSIASINTIELKANEPLIAALKERLPWTKLNTYTAEELNKMDVPNPSEYALKYVGTPSVCEASAMMQGELVVEKIKGKDFTMALSLSRTKKEGGFIDIVGAGPGDPELVSVRGKRLLQEADLILYAGSLVPERLTHYAKPGCVVRNSAPMNLEEQFATMKEFYDKGLKVVRLHTGDPCIYGAIQEQMALFDEAGMHYRITPGISAFQAAAAALNSQFTIPEKVQTIILTRGEGRTPMPEREQLHKLAKSQSTMCIYLSAAIAEDVQQELLQEYSPETPVAACYKLTWPEQKIYRGKLKDLAKIVRENNLTLTTLLVVGDAIDNRNGLSRLYADEFKHIFRK